MPVAETSGDGRRDGLMLVLACGLLFFFMLGRAPLANPDESRYAEIPREMLTTGDWVTPRLNGVAYFEKPPLVYWCVALCLETFGPSEWSLRVTPALFSIGGVLLAYCAGRALFGRRAGLFAAIALGTSLFYFAIGRLLLLDMAVSVLISATLVCFILGVRESSGRWRRCLFYGLYVSAALATLAKGLMGFLLPGAIMFFWLLFFNQWKRLRPFYFPSGILLFLAIAAPWHVFVAQRNPSWAHFYFMHEHWERFTTTVHGRERPWWFFVPILLFGSFPWNGFLPATIRGTLGGWGRRKENAEPWFFVVWAVFIFLFFSTSHSKLPPYVLPVFPALAVLIGSGLARQIEERDRPALRVGFIGFAATCGFLALAMVFVIMEPALFNLEGGQTAALQPSVLAMTAVLTAGGIITLCLTRATNWRLSFGGLVVTTALFLGSLAYATGKIQPGGTRELALFVKNRVPAGVPIYHYHDFFHDFTFYAERFVGTVEFHGDELELLNDEAARVSGRFIDEETFRRRWLARERLYVVVRKKKMRETQRDYIHMLENRTTDSEVSKRSGRPSSSGQPRPPVLIDRACRTHVICESAEFYLLSNQGE